MIIIACKQAITIIVALRVAYVNTNKKGETYTSMSK